MNTIINITEKDGNNVVSARELHQFLEPQTPFRIWIKRMLEYDFIENIDFQAMNIFVHATNGIGGTNKKDYALTLDCAKEISMLQRSEKGKQARKYFIDVEKKFKSNNKIDFSDPKAILLMAQNWAEEQAKRKEAERILEENKPKIIFSDAVSASKSSILVGELAKILKQNGIDFGQNRLFEWLRNNDYLIKRKGEDFNMPTQKSMELGLFQIKETTINHSSGHIHISKTTKVTGKGQQYFVNIFLNKDIVRKQNNYSIAG